MIKSNPDKQPRAETLGGYVRRILEEKHLTMYDVEVRSERRIADAYVANILNGVAKNLTVEKLKALAVGLGEPEDDVFKVARGLPLDDKKERSGGPWSAAGRVTALTQWSAPRGCDHLLRRDFADADRRGVFPAFSFHNLLLSLRPACDTKLD